MHYSNVQITGSNLYNQPLKKLQTSCKKNIAAKQGNVSFGAGPVSVLRALENSPMLSLLTIDMLGMVLPRCIIDLNRNKEELGHLNWTAGRETIMRESTSGPVLFFAPGLLFTYMGNKLLNSKFNPFKVNTKSFTDFKTLDAINAKLKEILKSKSGTVNVNELRKELAKSLLQDMKGTSSGIKLSDSIIKEIVDEVGSSMKRADVDTAISRYIKNELSADYNKAFEYAKKQLLKKVTSSKPDIEAIAKEAHKIARNQITKQAEAELRSVIINSKDRGVKAFISRILNKINPLIEGSEMTLSGKGYKSVSSTSHNLIRDTFSATDDIVTKGASLCKKVEGGNVQVSELSNNISKILKSTKKLKLAKMLLPLVAVLTFLTTFPYFSAWLTKKLNGGKEEFPGLAGLKKEDRTSFASNKTNNDIHKTKQTIQPEVQNIQPLPKPAPKPYVQTNDPFTWFERRMG